MSTSETILARFFSDDLQNAVLLFQLAFATIAFFIVISAYRNSSNGRGGS